MSCFWGEIDPISFDLRPPVVFRILRSFFGTGVAISTTGLTRLSGSEGGSVMSRWIIILALAASVSGIGCLESNPQPSPVGMDDAATGGIGGDGVQKLSAEVDEDLLLASAAGSDGTVVLTGMNGCAMDADFAEATPADEEPGAEEDVVSGGAGFAVDEDGGFGGVVPTVVGTDEIVVTFHFGDDFDPPVIVVHVPVPVLSEEDDKRTPWLASASAEYDPDNGAGAPPEEVWDGFADEDGLGGVDVTLDAGVALVTGLEWTTTPLSIVAVVNQETFVQASTDADTTGGFVVEILASSGDTLLLFAVNPSDKEKATAPTEVSVP